VSKLLVGIAAGAIALLCAAAAAGQDGLSLMKVDPNARPSGMGGAFVSIAGDPNGSPYNPASAAQSNHFGATFSHIAYWENISMENAFFAAPLTGRLHMHGGIRYSSVGDLEMRQSPVAVPDALFDAHDVSFKLGLAYQFNQYIAAGFASGWYMEKIEAWHGSSFNTDMGVLVTPKQNVNVGLSVTSLGPNFNLAKSGAVESRAIKLPTTYRIGGSYLYRKYLGAADVVVADSKAHLHVGAEAKLHEMLTIRAGYMTGYDSKNFTAGAAFTRRSLTIDYAFVPYSNDLGTSHLFSFTFEL
jgi:hypothetical protein